MPLIPWEPFRDIRDIDKLFEDDFFKPAAWHKPFKGLMPAMDVYEKDGKIVAEMEAPGIDPEKINIEVEDEHLRVSGKEEELKEEKDKNYYRKEIRKGSFERLIRLPAAINENEIEAKCENGMLKIIMPKKEEKRAKKVEIKVKK